MRISMYYEWIGEMIDEFETFLKEEDFMAEDMVMISYTEEDTYFFYKVNTAEDTNYNFIIEAYYNTDGSIYDIRVYQY